MTNRSETSDADQKSFRLSSLSRREFGALSVSATLAAALPIKPDANSVSSANVVVTTPDGEADCFFTHPSEGMYPSVLVWPDAMGLRPAFEEMAARLAQSGYAVLVVNPYYRNEKAPILPPCASFRDPATRGKLFPLMQSLTPERNVSDSSAFVAFLDTQDSVDTGRKMGTIGYCMGGAMTMRTAAHLPDRVGAGASFHGGRLVTDQDNSPHLLISEMRANYLVAIAENDDANEPNTKDVLKESFSTAGLEAEIEVYADTQHGWCPTDSSVYHEEQAERAWSRMLALFESNLV